VISEFKLLFCEECRGWYPSPFFRLVVSRVKQQYYSKRCKRCEQEKKDEQNRQSRFPRKAYATMYHHAKKYIEKGWAASVADFRKRYGWNVKQIAHDMEHDWTNGCPICHELFKEMGHGLSDLSLDIINPDDRPYYETNVRFICTTCNKLKQQYPPELFGLIIQCHKMWESNHENKVQDPFHGTLFEGQGARKGRKREWNGETWI
jgi:hypothetical protein